jgi:protein-S-isoprenylcysteine O-methyltransferase Ste14
MVARTKVILVSLLASPVAAFVVQQSNVQVPARTATLQGSRRRLLLAMAEDPTATPPPFATSSTTPVSDVTPDADSSPSSSSSSSSSPLADFDFQELIAKFNLSSLEKFIDVSSLTDNTDKILANVKEGEFGQRGEIYVVAQFALFFCILIGNIPFFGDLLKFLLGPELFVIGFAAIFLSATSLGGGLTPFPVPVESSEEGLVSDGIYGQVRHPMYAGLLASCAGFSILTGSATRLLLTALLIYVLDVKSNFEEEGLIQKYPAEYAAYMKEVEGKFFPQKLLDELPWGESKEE